MTAEFYGAPAADQSDFSFLFPFLSPQRDTSAISNLNSHLRTWSCPKCTFINQSTSTSCEVCTSKRETAPKTVEASSSSEDIETSGIEKKYQDIIKFCARSGGQFVDDSFPPAPKSLYFQPNNSKHKASLVTQWLRPKDILTDQGSNVEWVVFRTPLPSDVSQGVLGDCWLLSSLAVIAEKTDLVEKILITRDISPVGAYLVRLCKDGWWTTVIVDDVLPCSKGKQLVYSKARRGQLWVTLIEKAVAKIHGCYEALISGNVIEGLSTLTGFPCETICLQTEDKPLDLDLIWVRLLSGHASGFLMGASCGHTQVNDKEYSDKGLHPRHAYSVLNVEDCDGNRLLRLRNPWGRQSWNGDWSDNSKLWTPKLKEQLMPFGIDDGLFWMSFHDVLKYFYSIDICRFRTGWYEKRFQGTLPASADLKKWSCFLITVMETTEIEINIFQESQRNTERSKKSQLDLCVALFHVLEKREMGSTKLVLHRLVEHSGKKIRDSIGFHKVIEPGYYLAIPFAFNHWNNHGKTPYPQFAMSLHSSKEILAEQIPPPPYILADAIIQLTIASGDRKQLRDNMVEYSFCKGWAGLILVVENRSKDEYLQLKCDCEGSFNVVPTRRELNTIDVVPPMYRQVITILSQLEVSSGTAMRNQIIHISSYQNGLHHFGLENVTHRPLIGDGLKGLHSPRPIDSNSYLI